MRTVTASADTYPTVPSGVYRGTISEVASEMKDPDQFHDKPYEQIRLTWTIDPDDLPEDFEDEECTVRSWFAPSMHNKANLVLKLLPAIGYPQKAVGEEWNEAEFVGMSAQLQVEQYTNAAGYEKNKIVAYMSVPKRKARSSNQPF